jgi:hypothetical protein
VNKKILLIVLLVSVVLFVSSCDDSAKGRQLSQSCADFSGDPQECTESGLNCEWVDNGCVEFDVLQTCADLSGDPQECTQSGLDCEWVGKTCKKSESISQNQNVEISVEELPSVPFSREDIQILSKVAGVNSLLWDSEFYISCKSFDKGRIGTYCPLGFESVESEEYRGEILHCCVNIKGSNENQDEGDLSTEQQIYLQSEYEVLLKPTYSGLDDPGFQQLPKYLGDGNRYGGAANVMTKAGLTSDGSPFYIRQTTRGIGGTINSFSAYSPSGQWMGVFDLNTGNLCGPGCYSGNMPDVIVDVARDDFSNDWEGYSPESAAAESSDGISDADSSASGSPDSSQSDCGKVCSMAARYDKSGMEISPAHCRDGEVGHGLEICECTGDGSPPDNCRGTSRDDED